MYSTAIVLLSLIFSVATFGAMFCFIRALIVSKDAEADAALKKATTKKLFMYFAGCDTGGFAAFLIGAIWMGNRSVGVSGFYIFGGIIWTIIGVIMAVIWPFIIEGVEPEDLFP